MAHDATSDLPKPVVLGIEPSFGFGDRLGLATPGHLASLQEFGGPIRGIFAQQSIREMQRTGRTAPQVMQAAVQGLSASGAGPIPHGVWGADADHLKTTADVEITAEAGFVFFTIDPSDHVEQQADNYDDARIQATYESVSWYETYVGKTIDVPGGPNINFDEITLKRAAVKYGRAIDQALKLAADIKREAERRNHGYEIEVSVDETEQPTTVAEHYLIADQLIRGSRDLPGLGSSLVSLAPRFIGELEKGIDYIGDVTALEASLKDHAAIAETLGPYKLSLHSGSDKLSVYGCSPGPRRAVFTSKPRGPATSKRCGWWPGTTCHCFAG